VRAVFAARPRARFAGSGERGDGEQQRGAFFSSPRRRARGNSRAPYAECRAATVISLSAVRDPSGQKSEMRQHVRVVSEVSAVKRDSLGRIGYHNQWWIAGRRG
jgi:hypothetical protein